MFMKTKSPFTFTALNEKKINKVSFSDRVIDKNLLLASKMSSNTQSVIIKSTQNLSVNSNNYHIGEIVKDQNRNLKQQNAYLLQVLRQFTEKEQHSQQKQQLFQNIINEIKNQNSKLQKEIQTKRRRAEEQLNIIEEEIFNLSKNNNRRNNGHKKITENPRKTRDTTKQAVEKQSDGMSTDAHEMFSPKSIKTLGKIWEIKKKIQ